MGKASVETWSHQQSLNHQRTSAKTRRSRHVPRIFGGIAHRNQPRFRSFCFKQNPHWPRKVAFSKTNIWEGQGCYGPARSASSEAKPY